MAGKKANTTEFIQPSRKKSYVAPRFNVLNSEQAKAELTKKAPLNDASVRELFAFHVKCYPVGVDVPRNQTEENFGNRLRLHAIAAERSSPGQGRPISED